jgi:tetratricopeptide (TPR) repeat protein
MFLRLKQLFTCLSLCTLVFVFPKVCDASVDSPKATAAESIYNQGLRALKNGNLLEAAELYEQSVGADPNHLYALQALGKTYHSLFKGDVRYFNQAEAAYLAFIAVLDEDTENALTVQWLQCDRLDLGLLYLEAGAYQATITTISEAFEYCPDLVSDGKALNALGIGHYYLGNYEAAARYFSLAVDAEPLFDAASYNLWSVGSRLFLFNYLSNLTEDNFEPDKALYQIHQLRRIAPHYIGAMILEGKIHLEAGRLDEAYAIFSGIVDTEEKAPEILDIRIEMARILIAKDETEAAKEQLVVLMASLTDADMRRRATVSTLLINLLRKQENVSKPNADVADPPQLTQEQLTSISGSHAIFNCTDCHFEDTSLEELPTCGGCHSSFINLHPVDFIPERTLPDGFDLSNGGQMVCATCHRLHGGQESSSYLRYGNRAKHSRDEFCAQCHGANFSRINPHRKDIGTNRCVFCHATQRDESSSKGRTVEICNFCHGGLAKKHPQMLYFFDDENPIVEIDEDEWTCVTCHLPHGTSDTVNFLRQEIASAIERVRRSDPHLPVKSTCNNCHRINDVELIKSSWGHALRYQGDVGILCASCHVIEIGHHPMGVLLPENQLEYISVESEIGLNRQKRIDCYTCHNNMCLSDSYRMVLRVSEGGTIRNELCWKCHKKKSFVKQSPHIDDRRYCLYCHETQPPEDALFFNLDVPENVCNHCHNVKPHPTGKHLVQPSHRISIPENFPLGDEGKIICSTCHDPHQVETEVNTHLNPKRLRGGLSDFCTTCHNDL